MRMSALFRYFNSNCIEGEYPHASNVCRPCWLMFGVRMFAGSGLFTTFESTCNLAVFYSWRLLPSEWIQD